MDDTCLPKNLPMTVSAILVAGGNGIRMGGSIRKQYLSLAGTPVICHTLNVFAACSCIDDIYLVVPSGDLDYCSENLLPLFPVNKPIHLIAGGPERQNSVYNGLLAISRQSSRIVVIHDVVRPFVSSRLIADCVTEANRSGACIAGVPAMDTVKLVNSGHIESTLDRSTVWMAQTPQAFDFFLIKAAHERALSKQVMGTDDAMLAEQMGCRVQIIPGSRLNIKITTPEDMALAEAIYRWRRSQP